MADISLERNHFNLFVDIESDGQYLAEFMEKGIPGYHDSNISNKAGLFENPVEDEPFCVHNTGLGPAQFCCVRRQPNFSDNASICSEDFTKVYNEWQEHIDSLNPLVNVNLDDDDEEYELVDAVGDSLIGLDASIRLSELNDLLDESDTEDVFTSDSVISLPQTSQASDEEDLRNAGMVSTSDLPSDSIPPPPLYSSPDHSSKNNFISGDVYNSGMYEMKPRFNRPEDFLNTSPVKVIPDTKLDYQESSAAEVKRKLLVDNVSSEDTKRQLPLKLNSDENVNLPAGSIILAVVDETGSLVPLPQIPQVTEEAPVASLPQEILEEEEDEEEPGEILPHGLSEDVLEIPLTLESDNMAQIPASFLSGSNSSDIIITADALKQIPGLVLDSGLENVSEDDGNVVRFNEFDSELDTSRNEDIDVETVIDKAPVLEARDLNALLAQFEATEAVNNSMVNSPVVNLATPMKVPQPALTAASVPSPSTINRVLSTPTTKQMSRISSCSPRPSPMHQNIKDSLPKEIIEKIKASTKRKSTQILSELPVKKKGKNSKNNEVKSNSSKTSKSQSSESKNSNTMNTAEERVPPPLDHSYCISPDKIESSKTEVKSTKVFNKLPDYCTNVISRKDGKKETDEVRKDSGVESGNTSDSSIDPSDEARKLRYSSKENRKLSHDIILDTKQDETVYNKLPAYMTDIGNVKPKENQNNEEEITVDITEVTVEKKKKKKLNLEEYRMRILSANNSRCSSPSLNEQHVTQVSIASALSESTPPAPANSPKETNGNVQTTKDDIEEGELIGESEHEATPEKKEDKPTDCDARIISTKDTDVPEIINTPEKCKSRSLSRSNSSITTSTSGCSSLSSPGYKRASHKRRSYSSSRSRSPSSSRYRRRRHSSRDRCRRGRSRRVSRGRRHQRTRSRSRSSSTSSCSTCSSNSRSRSRSRSRNKSRNSRRSRDSSSHRYYKRHDRSRTRSPRYRRRSPSPRGYQRSRSPYYNSRQYQHHNSRSHLPSRSGSQSSMNIIVPKDDSTHRAKLVEERRVVYVGRIEEGITKSDLRKRFQKYGPISDISVHFRERGDNYGFVTFQNREDAYNAMSKGNEDPTLPKYDLCFGGRRSFCRVQYSDLDAQDDDYGSMYGGSGGGGARYNSAPANDFDALLKAALKKKR